ncbi:UbiX family flavin prenyltransferase [Streptomyces sp. NBC_00053]|uniref:non-oxidative hydroxyarylic acid decarboxylases subunit B n=1 Tax=unclassified Streptomyces TaxID=2593676 RepID=UPI002252F731|nr:MULTISPECIES: non-oxidative hydroxyarylic acid decarboxylases subunit B [unclassified Streptomyces]MCX5098940.1 non-oxidative hydroxyarylic acid decarboxylases subunit B [Streptomyces sp. NBC_00439]MCX5498794.1 non-oxidative hydroxyarylic acid decarboxylases subunit B [Streptomyces sp. NBC_00052]MCX5552674.1 non-oxidative hydroxyarylic acid decarboxylases subunit B [Streptomyces sp. NBC_00051]WSC31919.1 UbiX family flavin prenyltransferase [Streptomyces sp. NBC_01768]
MKLVVAMTGATGAPIGVRLLEALKELDVETHLVVSRWARTTLAQETTYSLREVAALASVCHSPDDQGAAISSGSFRTDGMVVVPCSMKTLASIRTGQGEGLIGRAADVVLKERRRLVLVARETPLSAVHLENMLDLTRMGAVIMPPVPAFYNRPRGIDDIVEHIVARVLDQFDLELPTARRWQGLGAAAADRPAHRARHAPNGESRHSARPVERPEHPTAL